MLLLFFVFFCGRHPMFVFVWTTGSYKELNKRVQPTRKKGDLTRPKRNAKSKNQNRNENKIIVHFDFRARSFSNQSRIQRPVVFVSLLNIRLSSRSVSRCAALRCVAVTSSARVGRNGNGERARASRRCRCRCRCGRRTVAQCEFFIDKIKCIIISTN